MAGSLKKKIFETDCLFKRRELCFSLSDTSDNCISIYLSRMKYKNMLLASYCINMYVMFVDGRLVRMSMFWSNKRLKLKSNRIQSNRLHAAFFHMNKLKLIKSIILTPLTGRLWCCWCSRHVICLVDILFGCWTTVLKIDYKIFTK